jgi:hypothetical protein
VSPSQRTPSPIEHGLAQALAACLGLDRIEPDWVTMPDDPEMTALPAVAYRQIAGDRSTYLDAPTGGLCDGLFLVEFFDRDRDECSRSRDRLQRTFAGPPPTEPGNGPPADGFDSAPVKWPGGIFVYSIEATDPVADADFGATDAHEWFRFAQLIFRIQYVQVAQSPES